MFEELTTWLNGTRWHNAFSAADWFVPTVQTLHILGIAVVVTTLAMLNVRLMRQPSSTPTLPEMSRNFLPWTWLALVVLLITGALLVVTEPARELSSTPFKIKMLLVPLLAVMTLLLQISLRRDGRFWQASQLRRGAAIAVGAVNLLLCLSIVVAGRLIAYIVHD